jgi:fibronectin-binding autotransporter adhesin
MLNGDISGAGNLTKSGSNTLTLFGLNTYSGNTLVDAGTLMLGAAGGIGDDSAVTVADLAIFDLNGFDETIGSLAGPDGSTVTLGAGTLTTGGNDGTTEFAGVISGTGAVVKEGSGTFTLSGVNTYFGGTTINGGTVSVGNDNNLGDPSGGLTFDDGTLLTTAGITSSRTVTLNTGGGTVDTNTFDSTLSGVIGGVGRLTKNGLGTLTLSGVNTYSGGTTINDGTVSVSNDNNLGDVASTLTFDGGTLLTTAGINSARSVVLNAGGGTIDTNSFNSIFSSDISGAGALNKNGLGTLTLDGLNTYTGDTTVNAGRLDVNGSTTSNTTVLNEATLGGNGTITGDVTIDDGGTMAPGNSIGQTNIVGNYTQNTGSTFELELRPVVVGTEVAGVDFDQTNVTGTATVNSGTTVNVIGEPGVYELGSQYRFLQTTGGLTGSYDTLTGATFNNGLLQGTLFHDANNAELRITNTNFSSVFATGTKNQQAVAAALDDLSVQVSNTPGSDGVNVLNQLLVLPPALRATAVQQIGGASLGADRLVALQSSFDYLQALKSRIRTGLVNNDRGRRDPIWVQGLGTFGNIDGNGDSTGVDYNGSGIMFGIDQGLERSRQGISVSVNQMDIDNQNGFDSSEIQSYNITAYTSTIADPIYIMGVLGYGRNDFDSTRQLSVLAPNRTAVGSTSGNQLQGLLEYGVYVNTPVWDTQVYVSGQYVGLQQDGFTETGADSMNLSVNGRSTNSFRAAAGMRLAGRISEVFEPEFHAGIIHELLDPDSMTTATFNGSTASFAQCGIKLPDTLAQLGFGATAKLGDSFSVFGGYDALLSGQQINHAVSATAILNY